MTHKARRKPQKPPTRGADKSSSSPPPSGDRLLELLNRAQPGAPHAVSSAEELDRLQASLVRSGRELEAREAVHRLVTRYGPRDSNTEWTRAWLTLVGGFGISEEATAVAALAGDPAQPGAIRRRAVDVLLAIDPQTALDLLPEVLFSRQDTQVRIAVAEALSSLAPHQLRDLAPDLDQLLETDLPRSLWLAVTRLRSACR